MSTVIKFKREVIMLKDWKGRGSAVMMQWWLIMNEAKLEKLFLLKI